MLLARCTTTSVCLYLDGSPPRRTSWQPGHVSASPVNLSCRPLDDWHLICTLSGSQRSASCEGPSFSVRAVLGELLQPRRSRKKIHSGSREFSAQRFCRSPAQTRTWGSPHAAVSEAGQHCGFLSQSVTVSGNLPPEGAGARGCVSVPSAVRHPPSPGTRPLCQRQEGKENPRLFAFSVRLASCFLYPHHRPAWDVEVWERAGGVSSVFFFWGHGGILFSPEAGMRADTSKASCSSQGQVLAGREGGRGWRDCSVGW